jgi:preprotein translocase subunit SecF
MTKNSDVESEKKDRKIPKFRINYKIAMFIPMIILILAVCVLANQYVQTGEWFHRSIELKGGTMITIDKPESLSVKDLEKDLGSEFGTVSIREIRAFGGYKTMVEMESDVNYTLVLQKMQTLGINTKTASVETIGPSMGSTFWYQAQLSMVLAFIFMGIVVFVMFRTFVPSMAVIFSAVADIVVTMGIMQFVGIQMSFASLAALLMLIGYSVDTDILLTSRLLRESEEKEIITKIKRAFKTGLTMNAATMGAVLALILLSISPVLTQIASVIFIGILIDIMNTWVTNAGILRWYLERKGV